MCSSSRIHRWLATSLMAALLVATAAAAEDPGAISFEVTVVHVSHGKAGIEASDRALESACRYIAARGLWSNPDFLARVSELQ